MLIKMLENEFCCIVALAGNNRAVNIECRKFLDLLNHPYLGHYARIAIFDLDIWFQNDINDIFALLDNTAGCLYAPDKEGYNTLHGFKHRIPEKDYPHLYTGHHIGTIERIFSEYGSTLNGGFIGGTRHAMTGKLNKFKHCIDNREMMPKRGFDQLFQNLYFEFGSDSACGIKYDTILTGNITKKADGYYIIRSGKEQKITGLHLCSHYYKRTEYRFKTNFPGDYKQYAKQIRLFLGDQIIP
jgi:hypothetical protein